MIPLFRRLSYDAWPFIQRIHSDRFRVDASFFDRLYDRGLAEEPPRITRALIPELPSLGSRSFDPQLLHPDLLAFYTHTKRYRVWQERVAWKRRARLLSHLYELVVRRTGNMMVPPRVDIRRRMSSDLYELDLGYGQVHTSWVRGYAGFTNVFYVAGVQAFVHEDRTFLSLAFPFRRMNLTVILEARNIEGDGLQLATDGGGVSGTYVVVPSERHFVALPAGPTVERLTFRPNPGGGFAGHHEDRAFGRVLFEIDYAMVPLPE